MIKLGEMIKTLRTKNARFEIRDKDNIEIGTFPQESPALAEYFDRAVIEWFPGAAPGKTATVTFIIDY